MVQINDAYIQQTFQARMDMSWEDFSDIAYDQFRKPHDDILMGYKFAGDSGGVTELTSEPEWDNAIVRMIEKIKSACTCAVAMELKNLVSEQDT